MQNSRHTPFLATLYRSHQLSVLQRVIIVTLAEDRYIYAQFVAD